MSSSDSAAGGTLLGALLRLVVALIAVALGVLVIIYPMNAAEQGAFALLVFVAAWILARFRGRYLTLVLIVLSVLVSCRYLFWRISSTMALEHWVTLLLGMILLIAEIYSVFIMTIGYMQSAWPLYRRPVPVPGEPDTWPSVDVFVPTYNEPLEVVRGTVLAAMSMDWPSDRLHVWVLDDGARPEFREFAEDAGCHYIGRTDNAHAKAGNINNALRHATGDYVAIFDCDHVPTRAFLQLTMGTLVVDPKMAMVQTPHHFNTPDPFERNLKTYRKVPNEGELFYGLLMPGNDLYNAVFFCGSCAVLRRTALDEIGGIAVETVTEDAHTGLRLHKKGWSTAYLRVPLASGLATESLSAHIGQRIRWARGMVQVFRTDNPLVGRGLKLGQRLCYTTAMIHFLNGLPRLIFLIAPLCFLIFGFNIFAAGGTAVAAFALPHLAHAIMTSSRIQSRHRHSFWSEVYEAVLAIYILVPTTLALISPKLGKFNVTAKGGLIPHDYYDRKIALPHIVLFAVNLLGVAMGVWRLWTGRNPTDAIVINFAWSIYNLIILGAALAVAYELKQRRRTNRFELRMPAMLRSSFGHTIACETRNVSRGGAWIDLEGGTDLLPGEQVHLSLFLGGEGSGGDDDLVHLPADEVPLPAEVVEAEGDMVRLEFGELTTDQEAGLVRALYTRADAWIDWFDAVKPDRPLLSYLRILKAAVLGVPRVLIGRTRGV